MNRRGRGHKENAMNDLSPDPIPLTDPENEGGYTDISGACIAWAAFIAVLIVLVLSGAVSMILKIWGGV